MSLLPFGKVLIALGAVVMLTGMLFSVAGRTPWLGRLPGDFYFERNGVHFYLPLTTSLLISFIATLIIHFIGRK